MQSPSKTIPISPRNAAPLRKGLFKDGVWCCNCPDRPPAIKFQCKNNGPNHGRWCKFPRGPGFHSGVEAYAMQFTPAKLSHRKSAGSSCG